MIDLQLSFSGSATAVLTTEVVPSENAKAQARSGRGQCLIHPFLLGNPRDWLEDVPYGAFDQVAFRLSKLKGGIGGDGLQLPKHVEAVDEVFWHRLRFRVFIVGFPPSHVATAAAIPWKIKPDRYKFAKQLSRAQGRHSKPEPGTFEYAPA